MTSTHAKVDQGDPQPPSTPAGHYVVTWTIDAEDATSPREAALHAKGILEGIHDPDYIANAFTVTDPQGTSTLIDLDLEPEDASSTQTEAAEGPGDGHWHCLVTAAAVRDIYTGGGGCDPDVLAESEVVTDADIEAALDADPDATCRTAAAMDPRHEGEQWSYEDPQGVVDVFIDALERAKARRASEHEQGRALTRPESGLSPEGDWIDPKGQYPPPPATPDEEGVDSGEDEDDGLSEQARWLNTADAEQIRSSYTGDDDASHEATALTEAVVTLEDIETARAELHRTIERAVDLMEGSSSDDARWSLMDSTVIDICEYAIRLATARRGADGAGDLP